VRSDRDWGRGEHLDAVPNSLQIELSRVVPFTATELSSVTVAAACG
jgi:hypothetical protein